MNGELILSYPWYFLVFCMALGVIVAGWLYYRDKLLNEQKLLRYLLFGFRAIVITALAFLLLGPVWKGLMTRIEKPVIIYLEDVSQSVGAFTSAADLDAYRSNRDELYRKLSEKYEVERYRFGSALIPWDDSISGSEKTTNMSGAVNQLLEIHSFRNVGALILASDGIYNQGFNPAYSDLSSTTSIYTVALGDSTASRDLFIQALQYPKVVYLGDRFQLDIEWGAYNMAGMEATLVARDDSGGELLRKVIRIDTDEVFGMESLVAEARVPGIQKVNVSLTTAAAEDVAANNNQSAYLEVMDGRKSVLLLYDGPHPDVKALKTVIENNRNYSVNALSAARFYEQNGIVEDHDLLILHGLPSLRDPGGTDGLLKTCRDKGRSVIVIISSNTDLSALNSAQSVLKVDESGGQANEVQALFNTNFNEFQVPEGLNDALRVFPPLMAPFAEYTAGSDAKIIAWQRLGDINTGYPLIIAGYQGASRIMIVTGEGMWRWRMAEFARKGSGESFDGLINQLVQYISVREDKRKFRLFVTKNLVWENEAVRFNTELYNANFELINESDVSLKITGADGSSYDFAMDKTLNAYKLDAGLLPVGNYTATASTSWAGENYTASVQVTVREVQLETLNKRADHKMLYNLSASTGGSMHAPVDMLAIADDVDRNINLKPVLYSSEKSASLLNFQWICILLLLLLTAEWLVRKWLGGF